MPFTTITEEKAALRAWVRRQPRGEDAGLTAAFLSLPQVEEAETLLLFWGVGREPDTRPLLRALWDRGKQVALPRCFPGGGMEARLAAGPEDLVPGAFGIPAPGAEAPLVPREALGAILVPCLCCDREGYRLGQGGGYYDRYLAGYAGLTAAWCPRALLLPRLPREAHDIPVDRVLTD